MHKRLLAFFVFALFMSLFAMPQPSLAAPQITIDSSAGFQNKVKYEKGLPLQFTVTNEGSAFSGDLVLSFSETYNLGVGMALPIELAEGESKTLQIASSGLSDMYYSGAPSDQSIFLFEGGWEKGKSIKFKGKKTIQPSYYTPMSLFVATLTDNPDRLSPLKQLTVPTSEGIEVFHLNQLKEFTVPTEVQAWDMIDYLVIDEFAYSDLPAPTQKAVLQWIQQGGHVVTGSTTNLQVELGNLSEYLPLELADVKDVKVPGLETAVPVFQATVKEGATAKLQKDGQVFAATQPIGSGSLTQMSFSLGDETVSSQEGYSQMMSSFFPAVATNYNSMGGQSILDYMIYEVGNVNELFESFEVSKPFILAIVLLYILLIVPVLYIVLKKKDKREYAWVIIPAVAILTSIGLFAFGAKDRIGNPQIQQTGFFEVDADSGLKGYYVNSLLSNRGGNYQFTAPTSTTMTSRIANEFSSTEPYLSAILERGATNSQMTLRDMRYWSVQSIMGQSYIEDSGDFNIDLTVADEKITGTIQNNFPFAVEEVSIWTGTRLMDVGELNPGETLKVNETVQSAILSPAAPVGQSYAYQPVANLKELEKARRQTLLSTSFEQLSKNGKSPYVVAYTKDAIVPITLENQRASVKSIHLIAQSFKPQLTLKGDITLNVDALTMNLVAANNTGFFENVSNDPYLYYFEPGEFDLTYTLPEEIDLKKSTWTELALTKTGQNVTVSILNVVSGSYEEITESNQKFVEKAKQYIGPEGAIKLKLKITESSGNPEVVVPKVKLKGVIAP
ncbi:hypothetical protein BBH88_08835 [Planococcus antarcticus DSM 14505]|uniref:Uncharacterized protein n=1 Tax=Planococcus antarcticus DSM 14505 TaxID=1185653 RepID=A0ABM6D4I2_9BACL|nr:hypothetical protein [Planococcus antarcticus]ANU10401.1 hypothetical protein BBH88_08835 [Planococcus antarcticus DSM 14505]